MTSKSIYEQALIYKATNKSDGKSYIGFTTQTLHNRKLAHKAASKQPKKYKSKFYNAIRKHGWDNFTWEELYFSNDVDYCLKKIECRFIEEYNTIKNGYNITKGGEGTLGLKHSEGSKNKIGKNNPRTGTKGVFKTGPLTEEHKQKISRANLGENNAMFGRTVESIIGKKCEMERRKKIGLAHTGRIFSEEHLQKLRKPKPKLTCPHCNKTGGASQLKRWHFDNCKLFTDTIH